MAFDLASELSTLTNEFHTPSWSLLKEYVRSYHFCNGFPSFHLERQWGYDRNFQHKPYQYFLHWRVGHGWEMTEVPPEVIYRSDARDILTKMMEQAACGKL
jgi:hypothetical protein